uniref:ATP synthase F0 subunit 6 n=1 Tax=Tropiometra macrodiscus TaxID=1299298 RepID=UPI0022F339FC|nr:ATP synthase F0 subunit 6 [Tropiometra macrodiscus]WAJ60706.1 ATP synthase F0 subunit 6 [Tropiometra macrodiscus]
MIILNSIFDQFYPNVFLFVPISILCLLINISWCFFMVSNSWLNNRFQVFWLNFVVISLGLIFQTTSRNTLPWGGLLVTVFIFILSINLLGLFPYNFTSTSHVSITFSLGFPLWLGVNLFGFYSFFSARLSYFVPQGTPFVLIPLMVWIETLSFFAQPLALGLRLAANLTAGHLLIFLLATTIWSFINVYYVFFPLCFVFFLLFVLELAVACIQAYVFTALVHFYLQENL